MGDRFIVICQQIVGSSAEELRTVTEWDGEFYDTRQAAIKAGLALRGSDDFNIGVVQNGNLISFDWMDESLGETPDVLEDIAFEIALDDAA